MPESAVERPNPTPDPSSTPDRSIHSAQRSHRRAGHRSAETRRRKGLRAIYFSLAAIWGCIAGSAGVLGAAASGGRRLPFGGGLLIAVALALLVAVAGGLVSAAAYRDARRR